MPRPNILFAFADDWGRYASAYRQVEGDQTPNAVVETPAFDRVAREGVLFTNAFVPAPSCTPCRSSVLSGRYFWECGLGAILAGAVWDVSIPSYPLILEREGYHIGHTYKVWSPGTPRDEPYGGRRTAFDQAGTNFSRFSHWVTEQASQTDTDTETAKQILYDETRDNFDSFLQARPEGAPFCYWWGPTNTHRTWERGSGKAIWGLDPERLRGRLPAFLPDVPDIREDVCDYLGECQAFDAGLGVLLTRLEERGELDNTFVVVSGDHGIPGMPRGKCNLYDIGCEVALAVRWPERIAGGRIVDDMVNLRDLAPTFLQVADVESAAGMSTDGLLPLLASGLSGQVEAERDFVVTGRERHVAGAREGNLPYPQRAIRTHDFLYVRNFAPDRWPIGDPHGLDDPHAPTPEFTDLQWNTYVAYADMDAGPTKAWMIHNRADESVAPLYDLGFGKRPAEELYDLHSDPDHMMNLADDPGHADVKAALSSRLIQIMKDNGDPRICDDPCPFEHGDFVKPAPPKAPRG